MDYEIQSLNALQLINCPNMLFFSGNQETAESIVNLSFHWWFDARGRATVASHDIGKDLLLHNYDKNVGNLDISSIRVLKSKKVPVKERVGKYRPQALFLARHMSGK